MEQPGSSSGSISQEKHEHKTKGVDVFIGYGSEIHIVVADKRQRKPKSANYRDAWNLILQWAARGETCVRNLSNSGEPIAVAIPSQACVA